MIRRLSLQTPQSIFLSGTKLPYWGGKFYTPPPPLKRPFEVWEVYRRGGGYNSPATGGGGGSKYNPPPLPKIALWPTKWGEWGEGAYVISPWTCNLPPSSIDEEATTFLPGFRSCRAVRGRKGQTELVGREVEQMLPP